MCKGVSCGENVGNFEPSGVWLYFCLRTGIPWVMKQLWNAISLVLNGGFPWSWIRHEKSAFRASELMMVDQSFIEMFKGDLCSKSRLQGLLNAFSFKLGSQIIGQHSVYICFIYSGPVLVLVKPAWSGYKSHLREKGQSPFFQVLVIRYRRYRPNKKHWGDQLPRSSSQTFSWTFFFGDDDNSHDSKRTQWTAMNGKCAHTGKSEVSRVYGLMDKQ